MKPLSKTTSSSLLSIISLSTYATNTWLQLSVLATASFAFSLNPTPTSFPTRLPTRLPKYLMPWLLTGSITLFWDMGLVTLPLSTITSSSRPWTHLPWLCFRSKPKRGNWSRAFSTRSRLRYGRLHTSNVGLISIALSIGYSSFAAEVSVSSSPLI